MPVRDLLNAASGASSRADDPNFNQVALLLNGDGTNGAQNNTFLDSSSNNITLNRNGYLTQGSFNPYGTLWSNYIPSGSYFTAPDNSAFDFGSGNFTIEGWANFTSTSGTQNIVCRNYSNSTGFILSNVNFLANITTDWDVNITFSSGFTANTWQHFAVVRNGNVFTCYINGASVGTQTISGTIQASSGDVNIGRRNGQSGFAGYMSNLRIVKGTAVYTTTFTPPTVPLTAISGTSLLTCQSNRFKDNSSNNFIITVSGTPQVQPFSPFLPTATYDTATLGGSGHFAGSAYLDFTSSAAQVGSNDFTWETWVYLIYDSSNGGGGSLCCIGGDNNGYFGFNCNVTGTYGFGSGWSSGFGWYSPSSSVTSVAPYQWVHVAITRSSGNITQYFNGVSVGTGSFSNSKTGSENYIGFYTNHSSNYDSTYAYMAGWRLVVGSVVYTGNFTPPTAPPANITNTALLPKYINAGIPDLAMQTNLVTVGTAQVSTSVVKYGTGSLKFDGSVAYLNSNSPSTAKYTFGTGDFTIEYWLNITNYQGSNSIIFGMRPANTNGAYPSMYFNSSGVIYYYVNGSDAITGSTLSTGTWYYITVCRSVTSTKMFINGTQVGSTFSDSTNYGCGAQRPIIGGNDYYTGSQANLVGYIDDFRITNGVARYTANFTPPSKALPTY